MNRIEIANKNLNNLRGDENHFILLGDSDVIKSNLLKDAIEEKIKTKNLDESVPGFWGTLGTPDDSTIDFRGNLIVSRYGNDSSSGEVLTNIEELYTINTLLDKNTSKVIERFINFDDVEFTDFKLKVTKNKITGEVTDNIPKLRLTIFLGKDEGALVFYEHSKNKSDQSDDKSLEYIFPIQEPVVDRDRITYIFPILPKYQITKKDGELTFGVEHNKSFVIKILTFERDNSQAEPLTTLKNIIKNANTTFYNAHPDNESSKYALLKFDATNNVFLDEKNSSFSIDPTLKTLLLLHGTFSTTAMSFDGLRTQQYNGNKLSWLQKAITLGKYEQILAFDHPTITEDAEQNVAVLFNRLNGIDFSENPIDIITTSRGGLVGKYLICLSSNTTLPVRKAAFIACANGSGYFTTGAYIGKLLGGFKVMTAGNPISSIILGIAQFSVETFLQMPGCQLMTTGSSRLTTILNANPLPINSLVEFQPIIGDWDKLLVDGFFKRVAEQGLDLIIQLMLGYENDWVIGTDKQKIVPAGYNTIPLQVKSVHTQYLDTTKTIGDVHALLNIFL